MKKWINNNRNSQSQGYNYEAEEMLEKSLDNIKLLDQIREEINLKYPFEASE